MKKLLIGMLILSISSIPIKVSADTNTAEEDYLKPYLNSYENSEIYTEDNLNEVRQAIKDIQKQKEIERQEKIKKDLEYQLSLEKQINVETTLNIQKLSSNQDTISIKNTAIFTPEQFINLIAPKVIEISKEYGMWASLGIANAFQESLYGNSSLAKKGNNLFGIKAYPDWTGERVGQAPANEDGGKSVQYRGYPTIDDSIRDFYDLMQNSRYTIIRTAPDVFSALKFHETGYAGDSTKDSQLLKIINDYNLTKYDIQSTTTKLDTGYSVEINDQYKESLYDKAVRLFGAP